MLYTNAQLLNIANQRAVISVIGCGGKTTFIRQLAEALQSQNPNASILITTTTKIRPIQEADIPLFSTIESCGNYQPVAGIQCMGLLHPDTGKFGSLPLDILEKIIQRYDYVLIEADGSRSLPCKGWLSNEPVIVPSTTHTVGIVTLDALNQKATSANVLRLPLFTQLTGVQENQLITNDTLLQMITNSKGMFWNALGQKSLFINKIDEQSKYKDALELLKLLYDRQTFQLLAYGSALKNQFLPFSP